MKGNNNKPNTGKGRGGKDRSRSVRNRSKSNENSKVRNTQGNDRPLNNDVDWYNVYPDLVKSTANIPTGYPVGINLPLNEYGSADWYLVNDVHTMRFKYLHGIGLTNTEMDAANIAATRLYSYVRHANSGHANYERTDLMLYFLGVMEVYHWIGNAMRVYGVYNTFNVYNREIPVNLVKALGWDYDSIADQAAQLRTNINNAIARVNSLYVPLEMNIMKRWWYLVTNCFTDSTGPKAGVYVFTPNVYRTYEEVSGAAGFLEAHGIEDDMTVSKWRRTVETMLDKLLSSEDIGIISGDILKAYGDRVYTLSYMPDDYSTDFIYSEEMLMQINNIRVVENRNFTNASITQVNSGVMETMLEYEPRFTGDENNIIDGYLETKAILNFQGTNPDPSMVMVATRLSVVSDEHDDEGHTFSVMAGSEIITDERIYTSSGEEFFTPSTWTATNPSAVLAKHLRFDYAPIVSVFSADDNKYVIPTTSHYENIVPVSYEVLRNMHQTALLSLFTALV